MADIAEFSGVPDVAPRTEGINTQANPAQTGGLIAEGLQAVGEGGAKAVQFYSQVAADDASNEWHKQANIILNGDPTKMVQGPDGQMVQDTGYMGLRGADAMRARASVSARLDELQKNIRANLWTAESAEQFDQDTRRSRFYMDQDVAKHAVEQQTAWATSTNETTATVQLNTLGADPLNPRVKAQAVQSVRQAYVRNAQLNGVDPKGALLKADQDIALTQIRALVPTNPQAAQQVLDANHDVLASLPNYDSIVSGVKSATINAQLDPAIQTAISGIKTDALAAVNSGQIPGARPNPNNIGNVKTAEGARTGKMSFVQPATPQDGVAVTVNNLRKNYQGLTLGEIGPKWDGEGTQKGAQWAATVSRVSGIGLNDVPNLNDPKQLESLIRGIGAAEKAAPDQAAFTPEVIQGGIKDALSGKAPNLQTGGAAQNAPIYPSVADYYSANSAKIMDKARADAQKLFPLYPDVQERYVTGVMRELDSAIAQQHQQYEVDSHIVQAALASDEQPKSEAELLAMGPQVSNAWESMQINNPLGAMAVERMFDANAKGKALTYGTSFKDYLDRVLAPENDPNRITNPQQLWLYVGKGEDAPLTNTGVQALSKLMGQVNTPEGRAFGTQLKNFVDTMHAQLTFSNKYTGVIDKNGEKRFTKFMSQAFPILERAEQEGKIGTLLDPKSKDYIGNLATSYTRSQSEVIKDHLDAISTPPDKKPFTEQSLNSMLNSMDTDAQRKDALRRAVIDKRIPVGVATKIGQDRGWIAPSPPQVPVP